MNSEPKEGWVKIHNWYIDTYGKVFGVTGSVVYFSLCRHADSDGNCFPSEDLIARQWNITSRTVRTYINLLERAGVISVHRRSRNGLGKWRCNSYKLKNKNNWKSPEEIVSYGGVRKLPARPQENKDVDQRKQLPNKKTNEKNTNSNNTHVAERGFSERQISIDLLLNGFADVNINYEDLYDNASERKSLERLVERFGFEKVGEIIKMLPNITTKPYSPVITTPYELEKKLPKLLLYMERQKQGKTRGKTIIQ